jgi:hypothetical protein
MTYPSTPCRQATPETAVSTPLDTPHRTPTNFIPFFAIPAPPFTAVRRSKGQSNLIPIPKPRPSRQFPLLRSRLRSHPTNSFAILSGPMRMPHPRSGAHTMPLCHAPAVWGPHHAPMPCPYAMPLCHAPAVGPTLCPYAVPPQWGPHLAPMLCPRSGAHTMPICHAPTVGSRPCPYAVPL